MGDESSLASELLDGGDGEWLPRWAYNREAGKLTRRLLDSNHVEQLLEGVAGPVIPYAFAANAVLWLYFFAAPVIGYTSIDRCPDPGANPKIPSWVYLSYTPFLFTALGLEWRVVRNVIPAHSFGGHDGLGPYKLFGFTVPFPLFALMTLGMSTLSHADLLTNGLFLAKVLKKGECANAGFLGFDGWYSYLAVGIWALMLAQLFYALVRAVPLRQKQGPTQWWRLVDEPGAMMYCRGYRFVTPLSGFTSLEDMLCALAQAARMNTVLWRMWSFQKAGMESWRAVSLYSLLRGVVTRFIAFIVCENVPQIAMQLSELWGAYAVEGQIDFQTVGSIALSVGFACKGIYEETGKVRHIMFIRNAYCHDPEPCAGMDSLSSKFAVVAKVTEWSVAINSVFLIALLLAPVLT